jgi:hypothetical protein
METLFALLASPGIVVGTVIGILIAAGVRWLAPPGTDIVTASAVLIVVCAGAGLVWELIFRKGVK